MLSNSINQRLKLGVSFLLLGLGYNIQAQQTVVDFSSSLHEFESFNGALFSVAPDPIDPINAVGEITNNGDVWEGVSLYTPNSVTLDSQKVVSFEFYNYTAIAQPVLMKLEDPNNTDVEVIATSIGDTGWSTLQFDFSQALIAGTSTPINASGTYKKMVLFVNGGANNIGTYLIDNIIYPNYESAHSLDMEYTKLVYEEEFSAFGPVDTNNWFSEVVPPNSWGWFNGEQQHYTNRVDNAFASFGTLKIIAKKESYTDYGLTLDYTSARLNSKFSFTYGRVDVRAKLPQGDGTWPAIWMLGTSIGNHWNPTSISWPGCGEIDIMEHWGNIPNVIHGSTHTISSNGATVNTSQVKEEGIFDDWHVYSVNWSPNQISFLMDGFLYYTYNPSLKDATTWPFDDPQFIILNVAMGGLFPIDPNFVESQMEVDYVRVYQNIMQIDEVDHLMDVKVYPNPASSFIHVKTTINGEFTLYNALGNQVISASVNFNQEDNISLKGLSSGIYVWKFASGSQVSEGQLIITNR